ncbi:pancreatic triacylglycerol lipase-like [Nomia melanderi]|uniref:pancreatic triacylglycerol lipase-like n=1 Tax=Nomia melanderi TaxID=2448451 RepID=UPI0013040AA0|nr:pancreatic triacylglycerol lipase-like [Nomia melanderi]
MKPYALINFLLVCSVNGFKISKDSDNGFSLESKESEISDLMDGAVIDDNGNLVKIDLTDNDDETEEETKKDLHNRVFFYLYTKATPNNPEKLYLDDLKALKKSHFNSMKPTKFVTHGWVNSHDSKAIKMVRDAYIKSEDCNVIVIDWSTISIRPYLWASRRVVMVAQYTSRMIDFLQKQGMNLSKVTIVGHSLGGHVAGLSAHYAKGTVAYVVALDPALPNFVHAGRGARVSKGDALYVEVIHTNAGVLGYNTSIGDIDFYPNGGTSQVGCVVDVGGVCSHPRSFEYFAESINSKVKFWGLNCNSYNNFLKGACRSNARAIMGGLKTSFNDKGTYFLKTNSRSPFAQGAI